MQQQHTTTQSTASRPQSSAAVGIGLSDLKRKKKEKKKEPLLKRKVLEMEQGTKLEEVPKACYLSHLEKVTRHLMSSLAC